MKKSYIMIIKRVIIIFIAMFILLYTIPIPINRNLDAVEIKIEDPSYFKTCTIYIKGNYYFNLLENNAFKGRIFVSGHEITSEQMFMVHLFKEEDAVYEGSVMYRYKIGTDVDGRPDYMYYIFGSMYSKILLYKPIILVYDKPEGDSEHGWHQGWSPENSCCIISSVENREEALKALEEYNIISFEDAEEYINNY